MTTTALPAPSLLPQRLGLILRLLCEAVAARGGRDHSMIPLVRLAWTRISRAAQRFERLVARIAAGRAAPARRAGTRRKGVVRPEGAFRLPRNFAWLVVRMPETASYGTQLQALLDDPAMAALVAAEPGAQRILKPLCRMLGVPHPVVGCNPPRPRPANLARQLAERRKAEWSWPAWPAPGWGTITKRRDGPSFEVVADPPPRSVDWYRSD